MVLVAVMRMPVMEAVMEAVMINNKYNKFKNRGTND
jgi:hypothetical protein